MKNAFSVVNPNHEISPFTGMTRKHWIEAGKYVLSRAFNHVKSFEDLLIFPTIPGSKTYPRPGDPPWKYRALEFEGLRRTTTIAAPLMHVEPEIEINGYKLREYYCYHFHQALTPGNPLSIPHPKDLPDATYQFTCEIGGLAVFLLRFPDVIWPYYSQDEKDAIADTISKWAHHRTTQNNWRFFNICMMSFLKINGYPIDEKLLKDHLDWITSYHAGDGWYLEQNYNYYTISMYCLYQTLWSRAYGDFYEPEMAAVYDNSTRALMDSFPFLFGRDGYINMWARSICYRLWVAGGFPLSFMLKEDSPLDPGWSRRLCSGALLQFVGREDFFDNDVPSLGFYGHREYMLQGYSSAASPFTMFAPFLALSLPEDSLFWTEKENDGPWSDWGDTTHLHLLENAGMLLVNHGINGTSEIIPAKVNEENPNYNRLAYNTHYPWEDHDPSGATAMEYSFKSLDPRDISMEDTLFYLGLAEGESDDHQNKSIFSTPQAVYYNGYRDGVFYRQLVMKTPPNNGSGYLIDLAEIPLPGGVLRIDRSRLAFEHIITLGHYGLPHLGKSIPEIYKKELGGTFSMCAAIRGRRLAMTIMNGWDRIDYKSHSGRNAESDKSTVIYAYRERRQSNPSMELMVSSMLHRQDNMNWQEDELMPIADLDIRRIMPSGSVLGAFITLKDGRRFTVDFNEIDSKRSC
jgi:hypothetical protein